MACNEDGGGDEEDAGEEEEDVVYTRSKDDVLSVTWEQDLMVDLGD